MKKLLALFFALFVFSNFQAIAQEKSKDIKMKDLINSERLTNNFLRYVKIDTGSDPVKAETQIPSTERQKELAKVLAEELKALGLKNVNINKHCIVTADFPSSDKNMPVIALFAHLDTSSDVATGPVKPQIHDYKGGDIKLSENVVIPAEDLKNEVGHHVITSDGTTLLGSDDKSGVAEIMETISVLVENPDIKRPNIKVVFTPDEETGLGSTAFDVEHFDADFAYTVDGGAPHELDTETFNAYNPEITIIGKVVHCGYAYKKMINSLELANEFMSQLPKNETPATTKDRQGYYYIDEVTGSGEKTVIKMLVRDFDLENAKKRIAFLEKTLKDIEKKHNGAVIKFEPKMRYLNMKEKLNEFPEVISYAEEGIKRSGLKPVQNSVRGGTDGSAFTLRGLLTPNLGAGGENFHSQREFVSVETMAKCTENVLNILSVWAERADEVMPKIQKNGRRSR
ncbi:MAG: peptidase T [Candidatus Gastranaerophilales bacterium]|nr:peptidase T [Candidatus Gastranaerophilales bacterium]